eukprot:CAMPEP_0176102930 /NCGR_PEP_ID=MMETSP0120_2-20121206/51637_1 /TAXON_ID=160619 /ORGANISM="Kryptoperidinium foliaceum, Strain CCMP 1326" /LENGTH=144 /DNA_ID=CAMNT_0017437007 /DNA_START=49 /DNA_END=483 /DNA_ORIENTATION=-
MAELSPLLSIVFLRTKDRCGFHHPMGSTSLDTRPDLFCLRPLGSSSSVSTSASSSRSSSLTPVGDSLEVSLVLSLLFMDSLFQFGKFMDFSDVFLFKFPILGVGFTASFFESSETIEEMEESTLEGGVGGSSVNLRKFEFSSEL